MVKYNKNFFKGNEILFVGYSSQNAVYCKGILQAFNNSNIKVYPYNIKEKASFDTKVYKSLSELPVIPKEAFVLLNKNNTAKAVKELIENGVERILFYSKNTVDADTLEVCDKAEVETSVGCPMMVYGSGFHKLHAFFAGVK